MAAPCNVGAERGLLCFTSLVKNKFIYNILSAYGLSKTGLNTVICWS